MLNEAISWLPAPRPVPHSKRLFVMWSIIAARSAERTGWLTRGEMFMIAVPMWICSVAWAL